MTTYTSKYSEILGCTYPKIEHVGTATAITGMENYLGLMGYKSGRTVGAICPVETDTHQYGEPKSW